MEFSLSTFILEVINFLVLMWILKHFLYRPVLNALEKRRASIAEKIKRADNKMAEAEALQAQYHQRLQKWDAEKQQLQQTLQQELQETRKAQMTKLQNELAEKREKNQVNLQQELDQTLKQYQSQAHHQGAQFASKILHKVAGPEVEQHLLSLLLEQFTQLDEDKKNRLKKACQEASQHIEISSAYPLPDQQRQRLTDALTELCEDPVTLSFDEDKALLAGLRIHIGAWSLRLNLRDELNGFVELDSENRAL
ncbi:F0F1 ATP synthase subunit delta [Thiomicrorhabdus sp. zzn3]|uniref:F0F1 ATP synthase subunit delta n=1 Tax=Thiomicrorhabdus sp. zzn3 TaxID=3039775 RepID=UPI0024364BC7|nr:F0F1 ATP synthase subunit delta [Thiomicrorhabdus sp. zzn3]MDG6778808.1 F0F1 ATP synthase subunit delta [Thiomicrorhabdus sp. zzn3]